MRDTIRFLKALARDRRGVGAIAPSSRSLAQVVVGTLGAVDPGSVIVELGPGTGIFTRHLARRHPRCTVVAIEADGHLAQTLRRSCPGVRVVHGCASRVRDHLRMLRLDPNRVAGVVSGLPLLSLPGSLPQDILAEIGATLPQGRPYVQFTYSRLAWKRFEPQGLAFDLAKRVMANIPPASVLRFIRSDEALPKRRRRFSFRLGKAA